MVDGQKLLVGIVANPESGCDVRRLVSCASVFPTSEKVSMVVRVLAALGSFGVKGALMMPDKSGIAAGVLRATLSQAATASEPWPEVQFLDQKIEHTADDTRLAVRAMLSAGVRIIVVLGGDGTHRVVASECGATPLVTLSTGTNNTFPDLREATIAGLAAGLCATGADVSEFRFQDNQQRCPLRSFTRAGPSQPEALRINSRESAVRLLGGRLGCGHNCGRSPRRH